MSLLFLLAPGLDLAVSRAFYDGAGGFLHRQVPLIEAVREAGRLAAILFVIAVTAPLAIKLIVPDRPILIRPRATLFVWSTYLIGVGLVVNFVLKEHWGRARPRELVEFGGDAVFSPVWWISDQCQGNCSFVSGEGAASFWLVALAFIVPPRWRRLAAAVTLVFAALVSATRIAMGGHFLSDVLIAWLLMFLVMVLLDGAILKGLPAAFDAGVDRGLGQAGWAIQRALRLRRSPPPL